MKISEATLTDKLIDKKNYIAAAVAVFSVIAIGAATPAANALGGLDKLELGTGVTSTDDGDTSSAGARVLTTDGLENIGAGAGAGTVDEDGDASSVGLQAESTDDVDNLMVGADAMSVDNTGDSSSVSTGVQTQDGLDDVQVSADGSQTDGDDSTTFGVRFGFED